MRNPFRGIAGRIIASALAVIAVAIAIIAFGILELGSRLFQGMMASQGESENMAAWMYGQTVTTVFLLAAGVAGAASVVLGIFLARRISRPLEHVGSAARQVAAGDYGARVPREGSAELTSLADSFNQMAEALDEQERQRGELIDNFAHELRTPLTNLRGYLEAMREGIMTPSAEVFQSLREEVDRLERLSRSLDSLAGRSAVDGGALVKIDLAAAVAAAAELARPGFERAGVRLRLDLPVAPLPARAVPDHLAQVLANLLQNAQRYTPRGRQVTVSATAERNQVLVAVVNTGTEIPAEDLPHIFERFYRVDKSRDRARGGAGIGLAIVKQLIEQAGGRVGAESAGGATRFWFRLPAG